MVESGLGVGWLVGWRNVTHTQTHANMPVRVCGGCWGTTEQGTLPRSARAFLNGCLAASGSVRKFAYPEYFKSRMGHFRNQCLFCQVFIRSD